MHDISTILNNEGQTSVFKTTENINSISLNECEDIFSSETPKYVADSTLDSVDLVI